MQHQPSSHSALCCERVGCFALSFVKADLRARTTRYQSAARPGRPCPPLKRTRQSKPTRPRHKAERAARASVRSPIELSDFTDYVIESFRIHFVWIPSFMGLQKDFHKLWIKLCTGATFKLCVDNFVWQTFAV